MELVKVKAKLGGCQEDFSVAALPQKSAHWSTRQRSFPPLVMAVGGAITSLVFENMRSCEPGKTVRRSTPAGADQ
jgi:hypothetical protein